MTVTIGEKLSSPRLVNGDQSTAEREYVIIGTTDEAEALTLLRASAPYRYRGLYRQTETIEPYGRDDLWTGTASYGVTAPASDQPSGGDDGLLGVWTFEIGTNSQKVKQSLKTTSVHAGAGQTVALGDYSGAIGWDGESVEGTDILIPTFGFGETHHFDAVEVTLGYVQNLFNITGCVNNAPYKGFKPGEVLFLGASGSSTGLTIWEISYKFAVSPDVQNLQVGNIQGINKRGWEYLWVEYKKAVKNGRLLPEPAVVIIEEVYRSADFSSLGLGT